VLSLFSRPQGHAYSQSRRQGQILFRFAFGALLLTATCGHIISTSHIHIYLRSCHMCCTDIVVGSRGEVEIDVDGWWWGYPKFWLPGSHPPNRKLPKIHGIVFPIPLRWIDLHLHRKTTAHFSIFPVQSEIIENKQTGCGKCLQSIQTTYTSCRTEPAVTWDPLHSHGFTPSDALGNPATSQFIPLIRYQVETGTSLLFRTVRRQVPATQSIHSSIHPSIHHMPLSTWQREGWIPWGKWKEADGARGWVYETDLIKKRS